MHYEYINERHLSSFKFLNIIWTFFGMAVLAGIAVAEPWSKTLFDYLIAEGVSPAFVNYGLLPLIMILRGMLLVEVVGYLYHRFLEHLSFATNKLKQIRKNQKNHWKHHMIDYPVGPIYIRDEKYRKSQEGIPWEWVFPGIVTITLVFYFQGVTFANVILLSTVVLYMLIMGLTHARFHELKNPWADSKYFQWLEDIHLIHHYDQATNYSITFPFTDIIFGTYVSPEKHKKFLKDARTRQDMYASDFINWSYMVNFAWPKEHAIFISDLKNRANERKRFKLMLKTLNEIYKKNENDFFLKHFIDRLETLNSAINS